MLQTCAHVRAQSKIAMAGAMQTNTSNSKTKQAKKAALHSKQDKYKRKRMHLLSLARAWYVTLRPPTEAIAVASMAALRLEQIFNDHSGYILWTSESHFGGFVNYLKLAGTFALSFRTGINNSSSVCRALHTA